MAERRESATGFPAGGSWISPETVRRMENRLKESRLVQRKRLARGQTLGYSVTLFALSNLWMARKHLLVAGEVRP
ncbi:hypothetical protein E0E52_08030 [Azotobacter chroococcum]|nr:hypothetical protein E0E52_08030 [Azotobacter chroococcum]